MGLNQEPLGSAHAHPDIVTTRWDVEATVTVSAVDTIIMLQCNL